MMLFSHQFHRCNAWVYPYEKQILHEVFYSYKTEICISAYVGSELHLWLHNNATHISSTTTRHLCRYLGERARGWNPHPYMSVNIIRALMVKGPGASCENDSTVYVYRGNMHDYSDKALKYACNGR